MDCRRIKYEPNEYGEIVRKEEKDALCRFFSLIREKIGMDSLTLSPVNVVLAISKLVFLFVFFLPLNKYQNLMNDYLKGDFFIVTLVFSLVYSLFLTFFWILLKRPLIWYTTFIFLMSMSAYFFHYWDSKIFELINHLTGLSGFLNMLIGVVIYYVLAGFIYAYYSQERVSSFIQALIFSFITYLYFEFFFESVFLSVIGAVVFLTIPAGAFVFFKLYPRIYSLTR